MTTTSTTDPTPNSVGDTFLSGGNTVLDYTSNYIDTALRNLDVGPAKFVFTKAGSVVGNTVEFAIEYNDEFNANGGDKYKATIVSGTSTGTSFSFSTAGGFFALSTAKIGLAALGLTIGTGGTALILTGGAVLGAVIYDATTKDFVKSQVRDILNNNDQAQPKSVTIVDTEKDISYQLSGGELIVNGPMAMGADALLEECSTFSSFLSEMDVETNGVTLNVLNQVPIESYTIQAGDTLSKIAATYGTTVEKLMELNPSISDPNQIQGDQELTLPKGSEETVVEETQRLVSAEEQALLDQFTINQEDVVTIGEGESSATFIKEGAEATMPDGSKAKVSDVIEMMTDAMATYGDYMKEKITFIMEDLFSDASHQTADGGYLASNREQLAARIISDLANGKSLEDIADVIGTETLVKMGVEVGSDAVASITGQKLHSAVKGAIIQYGITVALYNDGMTAEDYQKAAANAIASGYISHQVTQTSWGGTT